MNLPKQAPTVIRVPAALAAEGEVGLGDVIRRVTSALHIKTCEPCQARAESLNRRIVFTSRPRS